MRNRGVLLGQIALRDGAICYLCGQGLIWDDPWEIEHVIPRSRGGTDDLNNLGLAHRSCNRVKGANLISRDVPA